MSIKKRIKKLSKLTRELLTEGESARSDFKRLPAGISADDLVAFANSESGGNILTGVDEQVVNNAQIGVVRGCDVSDATILQILNKAVSCIPPVSIDVYTENMDGKPILRVEVPPSQTKPHCTPKGVYCSRDGARNRPLHPSELLRLFLDSEASAFAARFEAAAEHITTDLINLEVSLDHSIKSMSDQLGWAGFQLGDTESTLETIQGLVAKLSTETDDINSRLRTLFRQDKRNDPVREKARTKLLNRLVDEIGGNPDLVAGVVAGRELKFEFQKPDNSDLMDEDISQLFEMAIIHIRDTERDKKYSIFVKRPKVCSAVEIDQFAEMVAEGGEVGDGVLPRIKRAFRLGFIVYEGVIVGTAALKHPNPGYRAKVFRSAESQLDPAAYPYELGWIFLDVAHRGRGQVVRLLSDLLPVAGNSALFATTRISNVAMQKILQKAEFSANGKEFKSALNPEENLVLFVRDMQAVVRDA